MSTSAAQAIAAAEDEIFRRFFSKWGYVLDYAGLDGEVDYPTPPRHAGESPQWHELVEPRREWRFFTGLVLAGLSRAERAGRKPRARRGRRRRAAATGECRKTPRVLSRAPWPMMA